MDEKVSSSPENTDILPLTQNILSPLPPYDTLVLSGGGIKGFCLLGGLQALFDRGELSKISTYIGTSVGSVLGYLLSIGYTPIEILLELYSNKWLERMQHFNLVEMINGNGATSFTNLNEALEKLSLFKIGRLLTLGKLREMYGKTLVCVTYNMTSCETEYLGPDNHPDLPCLTALRMSCNIPLVFDRFKYAGNFYIDGGVSDNFPILEGVKRGKRVLGLYLKIEEKSLQDDPKDGVVSYFLRLLYVPILQGTKTRVEMAINRVGLEAKECYPSTCIGIETGDMRNMVEFNVRSKERLDMFSMGYQSVRGYLDKDSEVEYRVKNEI